jgi:hypothetical protein
MRHILYMLALAGCMTSASDPVESALHGDDDEDGPPEETECPPGSQNPLPGEICLEECYVPPPKPP